MSEEKKLSANEYIKTRSNYLRGTIAEGLADRPPARCPRTTSSC
jgi:hypothetical protein